MCTSNAQIDAAVRRLANLYRKNPGERLSFLSYKPIIKNHRSPMINQKSIARFAASPLAGNAAQDIRLSPAGSCRPPFASPNRADG